MCLNKEIFTFFLVDFDLDVGVGPEETTDFVEGSVLLLLVDLNEDVLQAFDKASVQFFDLELSSFE